INDSAATIERSAFLERFRCSRAAGISSTAARAAACSAARRSALATATLNFGAAPPADTFARSFAPTMLRRRTSANAAPPQPRLRHSSPAQPISEVNLAPRARSKPAFAAPILLRLWLDPSGSRLSQNQQALAARLRGSVTPANCGQI